MPDPAAPPAEKAPSKSKHSHGSSQAQPAPRKVRFNVGQQSHPPYIPPQSASTPSFPLQVLNIRSSMSSVKVHTGSSVLPSTGLPAVKLPSRRSHPLTIPCFVSVPFESSNCSNSSAKPV